MSGIFANFTSETCTGTGDTLTLTGSATVGGRTLLEFSESFADGAPVAYALEDSGGSIKVVGIGTYNSSGNTITRKDLWNFNGTVVDENPTTNITLSAGTHTISCDASTIDKFSGYTESPIISGAFYVPHNMLGYDQAAGAPGGEFSASANALVLTPVLFLYPVLITSLGLEITTASAGGNARVGIYRALSGGAVGQLMVDSGDIVTDSTGLIFNTLGSQVIIPPGVYFAANFADNNVVRARGTRGGNASMFASITGKLASAGGFIANQYTVTYGALPATLPAPASTELFATLGLIFK